MQLEKTETTRKWRVYSQSRFPPLFGIKKSLTSKQETSVYNENVLTFSRGLGGNRDLMYTDLSRPHKQSFSNKMRKFYKLGPIQSTNDLTSGP